MLKETWAMRAPLRRCTMARAVALMLVLTVVALSIVAAPPAYSDSAKAGSGQSSDGSAQISVSVSYESAASGSGGGGGVTTSSQSVTATIKPTCWYSQSGTGAEVASSLNADFGGRRYDPGSGATSEDYYPGWRDHADDEEGYWYVPICTGAKIGEETFESVVRPFIRNSKPVFVPAGGEPPAPLIDGGTLARAAWDAVTIPQPGVETNPKLGDSGATLVGIDTWVWATEDTPAKVTATATAGPVTATVTAVSDGLRLSAPDSEPNCHGFGTAWSEGAAEGSSDCTIEFTRSSAHLGGSTPLDVSVGYSVSYTATDGATGDLGAVTTTSTTSLPVAEIQTINNH